jgi:phage terminase large subunit-like protein
MITDKPYMTRPEVARVARCSVSTVIRAVADKRLAECKPGGKCGRAIYRQQDVRHWLEGSRRIAIGEPVDADSLAAMT